MHNCYTKVHEKIQAMKVHSHNSTKEADKFKGKAYKFRGRAGRHGEPIKTPYMAEGGRPC